MRLNSFRYKISLLTLLLSGAVLVTFGLFSMSVIRRIGYERIDRELVALADAQVRRVQPADHWRHFEESLESLYGGRDDKQFMIKVVPLQGRDEYTSKHWPPGVDEKTLPALTLPPPVKVDASHKQRPAPPPPPTPRDPTQPGETRQDDEDSSRRAPPPRMDVSGPAFMTVSAGDRAWRIIAVGNARLNLYLGMDLASFNAETRRFRNAFLAALPAALILLACGGWLVAHRALRPAKAIAATAENITTREMSLRIPRTDADKEFARLIDVINGMLDRLEKSFEQATRFSADAAHELKTPLAILQMQTERCLQRAQDGSPEQKEYAEQLEEIQRLKMILRKLLLLSQADSGQLPLSPAGVNLADMVRAAAEDVRMLAPDRETVVDAPRELSFVGDADLLNQVFQNLISNAVKFGDKDGLIEMALETRDGKAVFIISNTGHPIPKADQDKVFDRFYRGDKSRSREIEGSGLGLSLAREIARAHGGDVVLERSDERASIFWFTLPLVSSKRQVEAMEKAC